jgi:hypothetical protein
MYQQGTHSDSCLVQIQCLAVVINELPEAQSKDHGGRKLLEVEKILSWSLDEIQEKVQ